MMKQISSVVTDLNERFTFRKNDPSSQAKMQRMIKSFNLHDLLVRIMGFEIESPSKNQVRMGVSRLLLYYVKSNEIGQKDMIK